ncbi:MAG: serine/threonine-protein kinase [Ktedonobacteraceae bacterium]
MSLEQTTLSVGTLVRGRYVIKNILGAGHSGTVYLVTDRQAPPTKNDRLALKELVGLSQQERYQLTFNGGHLQQLHHPALPSIYHIFNDDRHERVYLVMDYIKGTDLETLRQEQPAGRFAWLELRELLAPIFEALTYLHDQDQPVFHGDIKPLNLIRQASSRIAVLVDVGYAQAAVASPHGQFTSTDLSYFRAPEHLAGEITLATEIYEMGATIYVLLTGQAPIDAPTRRQQMKQGEPDPLLLVSEIVSTLPRLFAEVLQRALALDPATRFTSMQAFWQALNAVPNIPHMPKPDPTPVAPTWNEATLPARPAATLGELPPAKLVHQGGVSRRTFLSIIAIMCVFLLVVLGLSTWGLMRNQPATGHPQSHRTTPPTIQPTPSVGHQSTPTATANTGKYRTIAGVYQGVLIPLSGTRSQLSLTIQQKQNQINGLFSSSPQNSTPSSSPQSGTFRGTIDSDGNVQFIVFNNFGNALYIFNGGFNMPSTFTLGGSFSNCTSGHGATCQPVAYSGGGWNLAQATA